jgi:hypothetical protein
VIGTKYEMKFLGEVDPKLRRIADRKVFLFPFSLPRYDVKRFLPTIGIELHADGLKNGYFGHDLNDSQSNLVPCIWT